MVFFFLGLCLESDGKWICERETDGVFGKSEGRQRENGIKCKGRAKGALNGIRGGPRIMRFGLITSRLKGKIELCLVHD